MSSEKPEAGPRKARKPNAAFMKELTPSPALAAVVGPAPLPRTEVTRRMWAYIKEHRLQDPEHGQTIHADATLRAIFDGRDRVTMFELSGLVNRHLH